VRRGDDLAGAAAGYEYGMTVLVLRRANVARKGGNWDESDYDVFDGDRGVGRIFLDANHTWFWGVSFQLTGRKSYGHAATLEEAKAAFRTAYLAWSTRAG
jgi:hypothetical protein